MMKKEWLALRSNKRGIIMSKFITEDDIEQAILNE